MAEAPAIPELKLKDLPPPLKTFRADTKYLDDIRKDAPRAEETAKTLCWFGMLPRAGTFRPMIVKPEDSLKLVEGPETTALDSWSDPKVSNFPIWRGKCPWLQNLSLKTIAVNAYTTVPTRTGAEGAGQMGSNRSAKAGEIKEFTGAEIKKILYEAAHTFVKPPQNPGNPEGTILYRVVKDAAGKWITEHQEFDPNSRVYIDVLRDVCVADLMYMQPIRNEGEWPDLMSVLANPPKSLNEA